MANESLDTLCINTIRMLAVDAVEKAKSGHPGTPMGAAPMAYVLWTRFLRFNPRNPQWPNRDRFVLSAGHASMLLYALLHLTGYDLPLEELQRFRQWQSKTPGHPEFGDTPGVEVTTGPLGQGFANGVGMAIAERFLATRYNRPGHPIIDHYTYALCSDGDLMEGVSAEAASIAGHLRLGKLVYLYDDNDISIEGPTDLTFSEDVGRRFEAYGWHVQQVADANDLDAITAAIAQARADPRPALVIVRSHIGYGSPNKQDTAAAHGEPLGPEEVELTKKNYGWPLEPPFHIPPQALEHLRGAVARGAAWEAEWEERFRAYEREYPVEAAELRRALAGELPAGWGRDLPLFRPQEGPIATRKASKQVLEVLFQRIPTLIGGSADLAGSNGTDLYRYGHFQRESYDGRILHFGVREHAMGGIVNGMARHGGVFPFGATFLIFSDYMRPALRLSAVMRAPVVWVYTHDSVGLGEDGPTHQPIEHLASLRAMPNLVVIRPADANEVVQAWRVALSHRQGPVALALTRQNLPVLTPPPPEGVARGAYVREAGTDLVIIATGSEVTVALEARQLLARQGISAGVVSMPSWELFAAQPQSYREEVLPPGFPRLAVEAGATFGWCRWADAVVGIDRFGASAPGPTVLRELGITAERVAAGARELLGR